MLQYLFTAFFTDGTSFEQAADDVSFLDPKRSSFYDLLEMVKNGQKLQSFVLAGLDNEGKARRFGVDLLDGHFEIDGVPFWASPKNMPAIPEAFKLIFFRQHTHDMDLRGIEKSHSIRYVIGWEANLQGRTYQQTIGVD